MSTFRYVWLVDNSPAALQPLRGSIAEAIHSERFTDGKISPSNRQHSVVKVLITGAPASRSAFDLACSIPLGRIPLPLESGSILRRFL